MAIAGVGVDAIEIVRIDAALRRTPGLLTRVFTQAEQHACTAPNGQRRIPALAARFAAKEAVAKALGTGIRGFSLCDIEVRNDELGRPTIALHGGAAATADRLGVSRVHLSLSTSQSLAVAYAVAEH